MKQILLILIFLTIWINDVQAEGIWSVNGYHLSNVNVLHKLNTVHVSGRIQGGKYADYLKIRILVSNDNGYRKWAEASLQRFSGKGELFECRFKYYKKSRIWNIEKIDIIGNAVNEQVNNIQTDLKNKDTVFFEQNQYEQSKQYVANTGYEQKSYPKKYNIEGKISRVLFTSFNTISVVIRNKKTDELVMMKSISPHNLVEVDFPYGEYNAKIIGDGINKKQDFLIDEEAKTIHLY